MSTVIRLGQAATRLGLCSATVRALVKRGDLKAVRLGSRWLGIEAHELDRFVQARQCQIPGDVTSPAQSA